LIGLKIACGRSKPFLRPSRLRVGTVEKRVGSRIPSRPEEGRICWPGDRGTTRSPAEILVFVSKEMSLPGIEVRSPSEKEDGELFEGCRSGSLDAFERLYETHEARMKSLAWNLLGNAADAEDAVQEAFLKVYRGARAFRGRSAFSTWIYRVLVNTCYDLLRKRRPGHETGAADSVDLHAAPASDHPLRLSLEQCLSRLRPRHRSVFLLFEVEGFTHKEIGEILDMPEGTSKTLLFNAKRELQGMLWARRACPGASAP